MMITEDRLHWGVLPACELMSEFWRAKTGYLTEAGLERLLPGLIKCELIRDKTVQGSEVRFRPDFHNTKHKLIVEFDGPKHYQDPKTIERDQIKDSYFKSIGYTIVRIPYFIQMSEASLGVLFHKIHPLLTLGALRLEQTFPNGFVTRHCPTPASFCSWGIKKYWEDLDFWGEHDEGIWWDILRSLWARHHCQGEEAELVWAMEGYHGRKLKIPEEMLTWPT